MNSNRKIIFVILISMFLSLSAGDSYAKGPEDFIAVVDIQQILQDSSAANGIREKIKEKMDQYQSDITKQEEKLRKEDKKLAEQRNILSPEALKEKSEAFKEKIIKVQRDLQVKRAKLDGAFNESLSEIKTVVFDIIKTMSKEKGFRVALPSSQVLYADDSLNITDEVLKRLNKELPSVKIEFKNN